RYIVQYEFSSNEIGFPCPSLCAWSWTDDRGSTDVQGHFLLRFANSHSIDLPFTVVWPGFLFNTATYAGLAWLYWRAGVLIPSLWRRRRGLCGGCGYDLRGMSGTVCPECGAAAKHVKPS